MDNMDQQPRSFYHSFILALMFLSRLPCPKLTAINDQQQGDSLLFYPIVGLLLGFLMAFLAYFIGASQPLLLAALLLCFWVFATGGLHLDGLADSADAWLGGLLDRERSLEIMKDPRVGSAALMAVVCLLLVKFAALASLAHNHLLVAVVLAPIVGRCVPALLFFSTPYARGEGLATAMIAMAPRRSVWLTVAVSALAVSAVLWVYVGWVLLFFWLPLVAIIGWLRALMVVRLGGVTGDTVGATVEIAEAASLVLLALLLSPAQ